MKLAFNMTWLIEILRICLGKQFVLKYYMSKHVILQKNPKYFQYQRGLASVVYKCLDKKSSDVAVKSESLRIKVQLSFIDNIWGSNLAGMQLISEF